MEKRNTKRCKHHS